MAAAHDAREREYDDDLLEIGGEFAISRATHHYFAGAALGEIDGAHRETAAELERAVSVYDAGPGPGKQHWFGGKALANIDLAVVRLRSGALDAANAALAPVLSLPPAQRITSLTGRLARVRTELARPRYQGSAQAREMDERIEDFGRDTIAAACTTFPPAPPDTCDSLAPPGVTTRWAVTARRPALRPPHVRNTPGTIAGPRRSRDRRCITAADHGGPDPCDPRRGAARHCWC